MITTKSEPPIMANFLATVLAPIVESAIKDRRTHLHQEAELEELRLDNDNPNQE